MVTMGIKVLHNDKENKYLGSLIIIIMVIHNQCETKYIAITSTNSDSLFMTHSCVHMCECMCMRVCEDVASSLLLLLLLLLFYFYIFFIIIIIIIIIIKYPSISNDG